MLTHWLYHFPLFRFHTGQVCMSIKLQDNFFDIHEISQRIKVQKPYFAFWQLWQDGESLVGNFATEQPLAYETGLITAGELGRHLAILGSCSAVALHNAPEGYYLATKAHFIRQPEASLPAQDIFHASARVLNIDKRTLKVSAKAWCDAPVAELICEYAILSPALFQRNFRHYAGDDVPLPPISPYQHLIPLHNLTLREAKLDAYAGPLSPQQCAGHFSGYPCWPVAIISQTAFQVTGELLREKYGEAVRFCVQNTQLSAEKLICADTVLKFSAEITPVPKSVSLMNSTVRVYRGDEEVVTLSSLLELKLPAQ
ncbi:hypothetical protein C8D90_101624 [Enterobacillus tribolii]|uniref:Uncharacterized protein n=2 Tax=Enterobacillus tribolii TaxID=1487935 RepID=A0A370R435_9GAMM|nr:hypothetical protein C8D90_101624 [Enterobacillus tribolii]